MKLLALLSFIAAAAALYIVITQIMMPALYGTRLFPAFRKDPLEDEVIKAKFEVDTLEDRVENLEDLVDLTKTKSRLERELEEASAELKAVDTPPVAPAPSNVKHY